MIKLKLIVGFSVSILSLTAWGELPSIRDTIKIDSWLVVGPFSVGAREGAIDYLVEHGGERDIRPEPGMEHSSILVPGGRVSWRLANSEDGELRIEYDGVDWEELKGIYGVAGLLCVGYAYAELEIPEECRALVIAEGLGGFRLNQDGWPGDPYGDGYLKVPVVLKAGKNRILIKDSGYGSHRFRFLLIPVDGPVLMATKDALLPDLIQGQPIDSWAGIPIINTTTETLSGIKLWLGDGKVIRRVEVSVPQLPPLTPIKLPVPVQSLGPIPELDSLRVLVEIQHQEYRAEDWVGLRVRRPGQSFKRTFRSEIDGSVQYYAVLPPLDYDPEKGYGLILTLHGAGVEAWDLVDSYTQKDWAFIAAPTNRRRFGFDWQDWGRLDAIEVLREIETGYRIDPNRIWLTGHSMGGHGVWTVGLAHPDRFAALAPSAGWTSFKLYVPFSLQRSLLYAHPQALGMRDMALREDEPLLYLSNLRNIPVFILHGAEDDVVPPIHARMFAQHLNHLGYKVIYKEVEGKSHWWDEEGIEGVACVDHPELMDFLRSHTRNPYPLHVSFVTNNLGVNDRCYWVQIEESELPYHESKLDARVVGDTIDLRVENVAQFSLRLSPQLIPSKRVHIRVNSQTFEYRFQDEALITFHRRGDRFQVGPRRVRGVRKRPGCFGPMKEAYFSRFLLIYGTLGDSAATAQNLHKARIQAYQWWTRANGYVEVLPDTLVTPDRLKGYNLILFGGPETNLITRRINPMLPIQIRDRRVWLGNHPLQGDDLAVQFVYPNPLNPERLVLIHGGNSPEGERLAGYFSTLYSGAGLPDLLIYDRRVKEKIWGGVVAAGFFDTDWRLRGELLYLAP